MALHAPRFTPDAAREIPRHWLMVLVCLGLTGCRGEGPQVVVYCALDREFSEPILQRFENETGVRVLAKYDVESTKSVGLAEAILHERGRPRCDVFWNNEILNTIRLERAGVLQEYSSPAGNQFPAEHRSREGHWYGFAARMRILLVNTERVPADRTPARLEDLADPRWRGQVGIAKPLFGTTATHVACLFATRGPDEARELLRQWKRNEIQILAGNKQVAVEVGAGVLAMGLTDTDDALAELRARRPVRLVPLPLDLKHPGPLCLPNTVSCIGGGPNPDQARRLVDFLLSPQVEESLARGKSGQIPLHPALAQLPSELGIPASAQPYPADFERAVQEWESVREFVKAEFTVP